MYDYKKTWIPSAFDASVREEWPEMIRKHLIPGSVIDIGCGCGRFVSTFDGHDYLGIDIAPQAIDSCKHNNPKLRFEVRDIITWNPKEKFDNAFTWTVFEHIPQEFAESVANKIKNMAKNIVLVEPSGFNNIENHYCISHDYEKLFGAKVVENLESVKIWRTNA